MRDQEIMSNLQDRPTLMPKTEVFLKMENEYHIVDEEGSVRPQVFFVKVEQPQELTIVDEGFVDKETRHQSKTDRETMVNQDGDLFMNKEAPQARYSDFHNSITYKCEPTSDRLSTLRSEQFCQTLLQNQESPIHCESVQEKVSFSRYIDNADYVEDQRRDTIQDRKYSCTDCGKYYKAKQNLKIHLQSHTGVKPFECLICDKAFLRKSSLKSHQQVHSQVLAFGCSECGKRFSQEFPLKMHIKNVHSRCNVKPYQCLTCNKTFSFRATLSRHQLIHSQEKAFCCTECGKRFTQKSGLQKHIDTHTGVRPYKCVTCDKAFTVKSSLDAHKLIHSNIKPFVCSVCEKSFTFKKNLTVHEFIHSGIKSYKCTTCGKAFMDPQRLSKHSAVHSDVKKFGCAHCGEFFKQKSHLERHTRLHLGI